MRQRRICQPTDSRGCFCEFDCKKVGEARKWRLRCTYSPNTPRSGATMPTKNVSRKKRACALRLRAAIEGLEPRTLLSTVVVNSLADGASPGTLRNAINSSAAGDVITFDPSLFAGG